MQENIHNDKMFKVSSLFAKKQFLHRLNIYFNNCDFTQIYALETAALNYFKNKNFATTYPPLNVKNQLRPRLFILIPSNNYLMILYVINQENLILANKYSTFSVEELKILTWKAEINKIATTITIRTSTFGVARIR